MTADITTETSQALSAVDAAVAVNQLSPSAAQNLRRWLTETGYAAYVPKIVPLISAGKWIELDALFWEVIPFGTGGGARGAGAAGAPPARQRGRRPAAAP